MNLLEIQQIYNLILRSKEFFEPEFIINEVIREEQLSGFAFFNSTKRNECTIHVSSTSFDFSIWIMFAEWNQNHGYYLILYPERRDTTIAEIYNIEEGCLQWVYSPAKQDGRNIERQISFERYFYSLDVRISIPEKEDEVKDFLQELFELTQNRIAADRLDPLLSAERSSFPEGKRKERIHYYRERNSKLIQEVKDDFKRIHGDRLFCQVCNFDFIEKYGDRGNDFIEAHHTKPLSDLHENGDATLKVDIALVCANCHRMIHRRRPWLTMQNLMEILNH